MKTPDPLPATIRKHIAVEGDHWVWTGSHGRYGSPTWGGLPAARTVWLALEFGALMTGEGVYRDCDRAGCVNPDHQCIRLTPRAKSRRAA